MMKPTKGYYVIPEDKQKTVNAALAEAGLGDDFFSVPLIKGNGKKATHHAASCSLHPWQQKTLEAVLAKERPGEIKQAVSEQLSKAGFKALLTAQAAKDKEPWAVQAVKDREPKAVGK